MSKKDVATEPTAQEFNVCRNSGREVFWRNVVDGIEARSQESDPLKLFASWDEIQPYLDNERATL